MRYIVDRRGHCESFKSLRAAKESMNTETLYFSLGNNVVRVKR